MILGPPSSTRTHTLFSYSTLFRSRRDRGRARVVHAVLHRHRLDLDRAADAVQGMGRRHELSWRPAWRAGGWLVVVAPAEAAFLRHHRLRCAAGADRADRQSVVEGKGVYVSVDLGVHRIIKK